MQGASMQTPEQLATSITQELYQINPSFGPSLFAIMKEFTEAFTRKDLAMFTECVGRYFQYPKNDEIYKRFAGFALAPSPRIPQTSVAQPHAAPQRTATPPVSETMSSNPFDDDVEPVMQPNPVAIHSHSVTSDASNPFSDDFETIHVQSPAQMSNHSNPVQPPVVVRSE